MMCDCGSVLDHSGTRSRQHQLTAIESKYSLSLFATSRASLLRSIGSRFLFQYVVKIFMTVSTCLATSEATIST